MGFKDNFLYRMFTKDVSKMGNFWLGNPFSEHFHYPFERSEAKFVVIYIWMAMAFVIASKCIYLRVKERLEKKRKVKKKGERRSKLSFFHFANGLVTLATGTACIFTLLLFYSGKKEVTIIRNLLDLKELSRNVEDIAKKLFYTMKGYEMIGKLKYFFDLSEDLKTYWAFFNVMREEALKAQLAKPYMEHIRYEYKIFDMEFSRLGKILHKNYDGIKMVFEMSSNKRELVENLYRLCVPLINSFSGIIIELQESIVYCGVNLVLLIYFPFLLFCIFTFVDSEWFGVVKNMLIVSFSSIWIGIFVILKQTLLLNLQHACYSTNVFETSILPLKVVIGNDAGYNIVEKFYQECIQNNEKSSFLDIMLSQTNYNETEFIDEMVQGYGHLIKVSSFIQRIDFNPAILEGVGKEMMEKIKEIAYTVVYFEKNLTNVFGSKEDVLKKVDGIVSCKDVSEFYHNMIESVCVKMQRILFVGMVTDCVVLILMLIQIFSW